MHCLIQITIAMCRSCAYLCTVAWTSSWRRADFCRTDAHGGSEACRWSGPRSAARRSDPPPGARRAQASPLSPSSTAAEPAAASFPSALHPWPPGPEPPQPDSSSSGPNHCGAGISLLTDKRLMWRWALSADSRSRDCAFTLQLEAQTSLGVAWSRCNGDLPHLLLKTKDRKEETQENSFSLMANNSSLSWFGNASSRVQKRRLFVQCYGWYLVWCKANRGRILLVSLPQTWGLLTGPSCFSTGKALPSHTLGPPPSHATHQYAAIKAGCWEVTLRGKGAGKQRQERERGRGGHQQTSSAVFPRSDSSVSTVLTQSAAKSKEQENSSFTWRQHPSRYIKMHSVKWNSIL